MNLDSSKRNETLDQTINKIVRQQLNNNESHIIKQIDHEIPIKYNSFNICVGKQGSSKTTLFMTTLIKLNVIPK